MAIYRMNFHAICLQRIERKMVNDFFWHENLLERNDNRLCRCVFVCVDVRSTHMYKHCHISENFVSSIENSHENGVRVCSFALCVNVRIYVNTFVSMNV